MCEVSLSPVWTVSLAMLQPILCVYAPVKRIITIAIRARFDMHSSTIRQIVGGQWFGGVVNKSTISIYSAQRRALIVTLSINDVAGTLC